MSFFYWCAACGNPEILAESEKQGYSMGKGLVGAAVLGPVGAVAGLDGKETTTFYCPKCGARLKYTMPDYEIDTILRWLQNPDAYKELLEDKRKRYPNMLWPKKWRNNETSSLATSPQSITDKASSMSEYDFALAIKNIIQDAGAPVPYDYIDEKLDPYHYPDEVFKRFLAGRRKALDLGYIKEIFFSEETFLVASKNEQEQKDFMLWNNATWPKECEDYAKKILLEKGPFTFSEALNMLSEQYPDLNSNNPYNAEASLLRLVENLLINNEIKEEHGTYKPVPKIDQDLAEIEEYKKDLLEDITKSIEDIRVHRVLDYVSQHPGVSRREITQGTGGTPTDTSRGVSMLTRAGILVDNGSTYRYKRLGKETERKCLENAALEFRREVYDVDEVKRLLCSYDDYVAYDTLKDKARENKITDIGSSLVHLEYTGEAERCVKNGILYWRLASYWNDHKEEKQALEDKNKQLIAEIRFLGTEIQKYDAARRALRKEARNNIPALEERKERDKLIITIEDLTKKKAGLGFFKGKEKKAIEAEILELQQKIRNLETIIKDQEEAQKKEVDDKVASINNLLKPIRKQQKELVKQVQQIRDELDR